MTDEPTIREPDQMLPIAFYLKKRGNSSFDTCSKAEDAEVQVAIRKWFVFATLKNTFGGSSDTTLTRLRELLNMCSSTTAFPADAQYRRRQRSDTAQIAAQKRPQNDERASKTGRSSVRSHRTSGANSAVTSLIRRGHGSHPPQITALIRRSQQNRRLSKSLGPLDRHAQRFQPAKH
jgi:hypothetical protein